MSKSKTPNLKSWLIPKLRRLSYQWPPKNEAKKLARVARGQYQCNNCKKIFPPKEIFMDHINPVVPLTGFEDLGKYVESLFVPVEAYQALCGPCHTEKTDAENIIRKSNKKT